jgi:diguanylate cyclase (GGDEF)-like protein
VTDQPPEPAPTDQPARATAPPSPAGRDQLIFVRARQAFVVGLVVAAAGTLLLFLRSPTDPLIVLDFLATIVLVAGLTLSFLLGRRLGDRLDARQAGRTRMLQGLSRSASSDAVVEAIIDELRRTADCDHILVARLRPIDRLVETILVSRRAMVPPSRAILPASILREARALPQPVADRIANRLADSYALSNTIAAPLVVDERPVGALILSRRQPREWSEVDRRLLTWSAQELSAALERAFAFEQAEVRASIDALTGLPNRGYLEEVLATLGPRRRSAERVGALMIDLDHFKQLNDRYGHQTGDLVLRAVGERISAAVRADDTPARYGGEEFAVLLRRASADQAVEVAERIRQQIAAMAPADLGTMEPTTVSIGVAVADGGEVDFGQLLATADRALYRAKREGRNRVVLGG